MHVRILDIHNACRQRTYRIMPTLPTHNTESIIPKRTTNMKKRHQIVNAHSCFSFLAIPSGRSLAIDQCANGNLAVSDYSHSSHFSRSYTISTTLS